MRKTVERRRYLVPRFSLLGQGFPLASYRPEHPPRREQFVDWTCTHVFEQESPAVAGIMECATDTAAFPFGVDTSIGPSSWSWPLDVPAKQKLASFKEFDPDELFFKRGAHPPLISFLIVGNQLRRSQAAHQRPLYNPPRWWSSSV